MKIFLVARNSFIALHFVVAIPFSSFAATPGKWKLECVGRLTASLPPDVEMAAISYDRFAEEIAGGSGLSVSQFRDGQRAGWSEINYFNGPYLISNELDAKQVEDLRSRFGKQPALERERLKMLDTAQSRAKVVPEVESRLPHMLSWTYDSHTAYLHQLRNHLLMTSVTDDNEANSNSNEVYRSLAKRTRYRELFSIPSEIGVCLPYAFISDTGRESRQIGISYRIKSQPDVMIVITDRSVGKFDDSIAGYGKSPAVEINEFWTQYQASRTGRGVSSRWASSPRHTVQMDGRMGIASFVDIKRIDGSKDIGYLAIVPGDPEAKKDAPTLRLFVVREANFAHAKGVQPIDDKAFLELAEKIAASVQVRRP